VPLPGLWKVTWPLFVSLGLSLSLHFTDAFFLSRISDAAAAAAGAINPLLGATLVLFSSVGQAGASVAGRLLGARRHSELPRTYLAVLCFNLAAGVGISSLLFLLHPYVPGWLGLRGEAAESAETYMAVLGGWVMVEAIATNVANISLNLALLHGVWGLEQSVGAVAGATVISLLFGMLFTIAVAHLRLGITFPRRISLSELKKALRPVLGIGLPSASEPICYQAAQITINLLVISLGATALATRTYVLSFVTISSVLLSIALGVGTQITIAHRVGAGRLDDANRELHRALTYAVAGSGAIALLLAVFHRPLLSLLTKDLEIARLAAPLFALGVLTEMGRAVNIVAGGALRSSGDAKFTALMGGSMMWGIGVACAYLFGGILGLGLTGVWMAMVLDEILRGVVNYRRWRSGRWRVTSALVPEHSSTLPPPSARDALA
jgi:Na+-driven multidrug efflux pump